MKLPIQLVHSEKLGIYSANKRVNSVIRTLIALYGADDLFRRVYNFTGTEEAQQLSSEEIIMLYQAAKHASFK